MRALRAVYEAYLETERFLLFRERAQTTAALRRRWAQRRIVNDQAYYVVMFAQLEDYINQQCEKLVAKKKASKKWTSRRLWDTAEVDELSFKKRVALLAEKGNNPYGKIVNYYKIRCEIAHGFLYAIMPINISAVVTDFQAIARQIKPRL